MNNLLLNYLYKALLPLGDEYLRVSCNVIRFSTIEVEGMNKDIHIAYCIGIIDRFIISTVCN